MVKSDWETTLLYIFHQYCDKNAYSYTEFAAELEITHFTSIYADCVTTYRHLGLVFTDGCVAWHTDSCTNWVNIGRVCMRAPRIKDVFWHPNNRRNIWLTAVIFDRWCTWQKEYIYRKFWCILFNLIWNKQDVSGIWKFSSSLQSSNKLYFL